MKIDKLLAVRPTYSPYNHGFLNVVKYLTEK